MSTVVYLLVLFHLATVLSFLRITVPDYLDGIFKMIFIIFFLASPVKVMSVIVEGINLSKN